MIFFNFWKIIYWSDKRLVTQGISDIPLRIISVSVCDTQRPVLASLFVCVCVDDTNTRDNWILKLRVQKFYFYSVNLFLCVLPLPLITSACYCIAHFFVWLVIIVPADTRGYFDI